MAAPIPDAAFHHAGVASRDIEADVALYATLGYAPEGDVFEDPIQKIRGIFLVGLSTRVELVAPLDASSPVEAWLKRGVRLYHLAYETSDIALAIARMRDARAKVVVPPVPAVAFGGRRIAFLMLPTMSLIELIEAPPRAP